MLEAPTDALALSTTMPLVPPLSAIAVKLLAVGVGWAAMSTAPIQPAAGGEEPIPQLLATETKRESVAPFLNSVNGEQLMLVPLDSVRPAVGVALFMVGKLVKPILNNTELPPPLRSEPHRYRNLVPMPVK